jgi:hypothetical protein
MTYVDPQPWVEPDGHRWAENRQPTWPTKYSPRDLAYLHRVLADSNDRPAWLAARAHCIGASNAAMLAKPESIDKYLLALLKDGWQGNAYAADGHHMEKAMLAWADVPHNTLLIHAEGERGFAATPDGIEVLPDGTIQLAECKRTVEDWSRTIPRRHYRQVWWAQYVLGAERTKFIWSEHDGGFDAVTLDPHIKIIDRDDTEIARMLAIATPLLARLRAARAFEKEMVA